MDEQMKINPGKIEDSSGNKNSTHDQQNLIFFIEIQQDYTESTKVIAFPPSLKTRSCHTSTLVNMK
jgi:hypothetical protein